MTLGIRSLPSHIPALPRTTDHPDRIAALFQSGPNSSAPPADSRIAVFLLRHAIPRPVVDKTPSRLESWVFALDQGSEQGDKVVATLRDWLQADRPRSMLAIVNPFSGRKRGGKVAAQWVIPLLTIAHEDNKIDVQQTERAGHATELAANLTFQSYNGALLVGGDGIVHEFLNGLLRRPDWNQARQHLPVAHVAAGSGNGLAASFNSLCPGRTVLAAIKGWTAPLDMMAVYQDAWGHIPKFCHLSFTWAYLADVNLEAEPLRWMGPIRFEVMAAVRLLRARSYRATIAYIPSDDDRPVGEPRPQPPSPTRPTTDSACTPTGTAPLLKCVSESLPPSADAAETYYHPATDHAHLPITSILSSSSSSPWRILPATSYFYLTIHNVPHQTSTFNAAPHAHPHDGAMDVCFLTSDGPNPARLVPYLVDQSRGAHIGGPGVRYQKCRALAIIPDTDAMQGGNMVADGEKVPCAPVRLEVVPGLIRKFVPRDWMPGEFAKRAGDPSLLKGLSEGHGKVTAQDKTLEKKGMSSTVKVQRTAGMDEAHQGEDGATAAPTVVAAL
ncbi:ATP-NAD kinase-like domain-containing protein [Catenaria anguillulae PL171]|uniref:ATP-NAD kinase-like domain-containing protein n=1 Tax=Catenaria anguillulae PL171 TaxID=765915 RepID=A0A1Y2HRY7_9FUNG|nr:ATP-NAD kinase-like domain-containing protein [Catenaria anguillulae PL171]